MRPDHTERGLPGRQRTQSDHRLLAGGRADRSEGRVVGPVVVERVCDVRQWHVCTGAGHPVSQGGGHLGHPLSALAADHQGGHLRDRGRLGHAHLRGLLEHNVGVRATETE